MPLGLRQCAARRRPTAERGLAVQPRGAVPRARCSTPARWPTTRALQPPWREATAAWLQRGRAGDRAGGHSAACLLDLEGVIVDGSFGRALLTELLQALDVALDRYSWEGVTRPAVLAGTIGSDARAIGGALLPLYAALRARPRPVPEDRELTARPEETRHASPDRAHLADRRPAARHFRPAQEGRGVPGARLPGELRAVGVRCAGRHRGAHAGAGR